MKLSSKRMGRPSVGGLIATRQGSLALALLCAVIAAGVLMFALGRYKTGLKTTTPQATVLVSTGIIHKGTPAIAIASQRLYKSTPIVASQLAPGAIGNAAALAGQTAQADILPGQQLTTSEFGVVVGVAASLAPGLRAMSISIDESHGNADVLAAGDRVDMYWETSVKQSPVLTLLVSNALVIKPASAVPVKAGGTVISGSSLVVAITSVQAAQVAYAADNGKLYLSLRSQNASPTPGGLTTAASILASDSGSGSAAAAASAAANAAGTAGASGASTTPSGSSPTTTTGTSNTTPTRKHP